MHYFCVIVPFKHTFPRSVFPTTSTYPAHANRENSPLLSRRTQSETGDSFNEMFLRLPSSPRNFFLITHQVFPEPNILHTNTCEEEQMNLQEYKSITIQRQKGEYPLQYLQQLDLRDRYSLVENILSISWKIQRMFMDFMVANPIYLIDRNSHRLQCQPGTNLIQNRESCLYLLI